MGDPALLLPCFHTLEEIQSSEVYSEIQQLPSHIKDLVILPHIGEHDELKKLLDQLKVDGKPASRFKDNVVKLDTPWEKIVARIVSAKLVISTAFHPIVVADAYRIPVCWVSDTRLPTASGDSRFKYNDYLTGTRGVPDLHCAKLEDALSGTPNPLPLIEEDAIKKLQDGL